MVRGTNLTWLEDGVSKTVISHPCKHSSELTQLAWLLLKLHNLQVTPSDLTLSSVNAIINDYVENTS